jgi:hypothetical protein
MLVERKKRKERKKERESPTTCKECETARGGDIIILQNNLLAVNPSPYYVIN